MASPNKIFLLSSQEIPFNNSPLPMPLSISQRRDRIQCPCRLTIFTHFAMRAANREIASSQTIPLGHQFIMLTILATMKLASQCTRVL
jgi:hypothetical protein